MQRNMLLWICLVFVTFQYQLEQRANIKFCRKSGLSPIDTWRSLHAAYGNDCLSKVQVRFWFRRFASGEESIKDKPRSGQPNTRQWKMQQISATLDQDRRKSIRQLSEEVDLPETSVHHVLHHDLMMSKKSCKFVPHVLTSEQQHHRMRLASDNLDLLRTQPHFLEKIITCDETWVSVYEQQSKIESCQWLPKGSNRPLKALRVQGVQKTMMTVFFDVCRILLVDFLLRGETMDSKYYCGLLKKLKDRIRHQRPGMWKGGVDGRTDRDFLFHQDNAGVHTSNETLTFFGLNDFKLVAHPQYSLDMAPCDFFLFPFLKKHLSGRHFQNLVELQTAIKDIFKHITTDMFEDCFKAWAFRWKKCVLSLGAYFEGQGVEVDDVSMAADSSSENSDSSSENPDSEAEGNDSTDPE